MLHHAVLSLLILMHMNRQITYRQYKWGSMILTGRNPFPLLPDSSRTYFLLSSAAWLEQLLVCFSAVAKPGAAVSIHLHGGRTEVAADLYLYCCQDCFCLDCCQQ